MLHSSAGATPLPPIEIYYDSDTYLSAISAEGCAAVLRDLDVDDEYIRSTRVITTDHENTTEIPVANMGASLVHPNASESLGIDSNGEGIVFVHMGSIVEAQFSEEARKLVSGQPFADAKLQSSLLIEGLSQRADLVHMGKDALRTEREAAEKEIRRRHIIKATAKNMLAGAGIIAGDIAVVQHDVIPTPAGWVVGALGIIAAGWWAKTSAAIGFYTDKDKLDTFKAWPDQKRARERKHNYLRDKNMPLLLIPKD